MTKTISMKAQKTNLLPYCMLALVFGLAACQQASQTQQSQSPLSTAQPAAVATVLPADDADLVGDLIEQVESKQNESDQEIEIAAVRSAEPLPEDKQRSQLAEQALNAALGLLKTKQPKPEQQVQPFSLPDKQDIRLRIGLLLPLSGEYAALGQDIAGGAEMALFQLNDADIDIVFFDTAGGGRAEQAAREAVASEVDVVIGPLFTTSVRQARPILAASAVPVLALSNNVESASPGNWVLGYLPEQQIDHLLGYAVSENKTRIAILASEDTFGQQVLSHTVLRLSEFGFAPVQITSLTADILSDEDSLKQAIRDFSRYQKPEQEDAPLPPAAYDVLILAGGPDFILRTAPVLSFYDLDPSRVTYLGTDLWTRSDLMSEPSLQGSVITQATLPNSEGFEKQWQSVFNRPSNTLARLGFDAFALIAITKQEMKLASERASDAVIDWRASLIREQGFAGFSGQFKLLPDGRNQRQYQLYRLEQNQIRVLDL